MKKVLVTGAAGYIGSVLVRQLLSKGYFVKGIDILKFGGESLLGFINNPRFHFLKGDIRKQRDVMDALEGVDHIVHLAAIVGDPACFHEPNIAEETNWIATRNLFDLSHKKKRVQRFLFASTCSNYGKGDSREFISEDSPLNPVSLYAELKVRFEDYLLNKDIRAGFCPVSLRFATVYGISPRMRFDLTVNEFVRETTLGKVLDIYGEQFWRPYCHVSDLARACVIILEANEKKVKGEVFNVGETSENYQKRMIAEEISKIIPEAKIRFIHKDEDPRDYRVNFDKIKNRLGFRISRTVPQGILEINSLLKNGIISDPYSSKYRNV